MQAAAPTRAEKRVVKNAAQPIRRRLSFWIAYLSVATVVVLLAVEGITRVLGLAPPLVREYQGFVADPYLPYKPRPLSTLAGRSASDEFDFEYSHNSLGFRDVEHAPAKSDGVFRILALGDSFTYGVGAPFEQTYLSVLEKMLNVRGGEHPTVEIIKAGIPNYFPETERLVLEHYGLRFAPDLVLVAFLPNDVIDTYHGLQAVKVSKLGYLTTRYARQLGETGTWLYVHSHLARVVLRRYVAYRMSRGNRDRWPEVYKADGYHERDWREVESQYRRMIELAGANNAKIAFVHIPQDDPWQDRDSYPPGRLSKWCAEQRVTFIDTLGPMKSALGRSPGPEGPGPPGSEALYWQKDRHCTPAGYRVISETLYRALSDEGLVP